VIVLAESNFVLELALQQEQFEHAERILRLAEEKCLQLLVPACSLLEPYQTLTRRRRERKEFSRRLQDEVKLLERSALHDGMAATSQHVANTLDAGTEVERESLEKIIDRVTRVCTVPVLSVDIVRLGQAMQLAYALEPQDAIVMASIDTALEGLEAGPKVFVNKNSKDFARPLVERQLEKHGCRLITSFSGACQFIENGLTKPVAGEPTRE
jgi:predicted nucleic acid-binding protein